MLESKVEIWKPLWRLQDIGEVKGVREMLKWEEEHIQVAVLGGEGGEAEDRWVERGSKALSS